MPSPDILRMIAGQTPYPGSPPNPVNRVPGAAPGAPAGAPASEPASLAELATAVKEALAAARGKLEELQAAAETAEAMDPATEKLISSTAAQVAKLDDDFASAAESLGGAADEHEGMINGDIP